MRTTVNIPDDLLRAAQQRAKERGVPVGTVIGDALRRSLHERPLKAAPPIPIHKGRGGLRPGVNTNSNRELLELLDEGTPPEALR